MVHEERTIKERPRHELLKLENEVDEESDSQNGRLQDLTNDNER